MAITNTIRRWLTRQLLGKEQERLRELALSALEDWKMIPYLRGKESEELLDSLSEVDPHLISYVMSQINYSSLGSDPSSTSSYRKEVVRQSRSLFLTDPLVSFSVDLWTDYATGQRVNLAFSDEEAQQVWDEFFAADRNSPVLSEREIHHLSEVELVDGEVFFVIFASTIDGQATVRTVPTDQIDDIIYDPEDSGVPLFYKRSYAGVGGVRQELYYPDWHTPIEKRSRVVLPPGAVRADLVRNGPSSLAGTDVVMLHAAYRKIGGRGWPLITSSLDWVRVHKGFVQDRAAVSKAAATWVEQLRAKNTGQRGIDRIRRQIGTTLNQGNNENFERNPPPVAGSTWIANENIEREWLNRPTNAGDAEKDGMAILTQLGLGVKLYPHWLGRGDYYRLATASAMEGPTLRSFNRYQAFWKSVWADLSKIVLGFAENYGAKTFDEEMTTEVNMGLILSTAPDEIRLAVEDLNDAYDRGLVPLEAAKPAYQALLETSFSGLGIAGVDEIFAPMEVAQMTESAKEVWLSELQGQKGYSQSINAAVRGLWSGAYDRSQFVDEMKLALEVGLKQAWTEGMAKGGLRIEDITEEEEVEFANFVLEQYSYLNGFADFVHAHNKESGGRLADLSYRVSLWHNAYSKAATRAFMLAESDPLCTWSYGPTDHCKDCKWANGKTYRKSIWAKYGWEPQSESLECGGLRCECSLDPAAPGVRGTRGRPKMLVGG